MSILSNLQSRLRIKATHSRILAITLIILYHGDSNRSPNHVALAPHTPHYITTTSSTRNKGEMKAYLPEQLRWLLMLVDENQGPCFSDFVLLPAAWIGSNISWKLEAMKTRPRQ
ncbi:unnamed protein product [Lathyrus oleraceus]